MSLEDIDRRYAEWEQQQANNANAPSSTLSNEDALQMGLLHQEEPQQPQQQETQEPQGDSFVDYLNSDKEYEKLGAWNTTKDIAKAVGTEASHFFMPKKWEKQYEAKTHFAENMKYLYRYGVGTAAFLMGGEVLAGIKGLGVAGKVLSGAGKVLTYKPFKAVGAGLKAAHAGKSAKAAIIGANAINGMVEGAVAGVLADYNLYRPEEGEGQLADMFGETDNKLISFLQTDPNAPEYQERLKNVIGGLVVAIPVGAGIEVGVKPLFAKQLRGLHKAINGKNPKKAAEGVQEFQEASEALTNKAQTMDTWEKVKSLAEEADETGEELDKLIIDNFPSDMQAEAREMGKLHQAGEDIFPYDDGTWSIRVTNSWEDAHKVSLDEYQRQLKEADPNGNLGITHQDEAIRSTWTNRGWIGANEELTQQNAKKIVTNYKDKFQIDNNIKVEFIDGLVDEKTKLPVEGSTTKTSYLGKTSKTKQNAIDKKKLQIKKLEDKITMAEGGNKEVSDPLDNLKEELRIAKNELKELQTPPEKIKDITIKIDKNAPNKFATLRAEIEHARDLAKGEKPAKADIEGSGEHFARYIGDNETEVAPQYTYKKSVGRNKALTDIANNTELKNRVQQYEAEGFSYRDVPPNQLDPANKVYIVKDGKQLGNLSYDVTEDGYLHIDHVVNETLPENDFKKIHTEPTHGVADRLIEKAMADNPNIKGLIWNLAEGDDPLRLLNGFKRRHPEWADRIYTDEEFENLAKSSENNYNVSRGGSDEGSYTGQGQERNVLETPQDNISNVRGEKSSNPSTRGKQELNGDRDILQGSSTVDGRGEITNPNILKTQSTDDIVQGLTSGEIKVTSVEDLEAVISKFEQLDPDISGKKFIDVATDADSWFNKNINNGSVEDAIAYAKSLSGEDAKTVDRIVRKQISTAKLSQLLQGQIVKATDENLDNILTSLKNISKYVEEYNKSIAAAFGRALRYQALNKQALEEFATAGLSQAEKDGLIDIADVVNNIFKETLNFTRTTPLKVKEAFWKYMEQQNIEFYNAALQDPALLRRMNKILDNCVKSKENFSPQMVIKQMAYALSEEEAQRTAWWVKLCDTTEGIYNVMNKASKATAAYMINNVLGFRSLVNNIIGAGRTITYPMNKILGGFLTGNQYITREGVRTYQNMLVNFGEALRLAKQAFKNGDGILTNTKSFTDDVLQKGFNEWSFSFRDLEQTGLTIQNIHSFFPRLMMASDELLSQLNYRSIMRAKAQELVDNEAAIRGFSPEELASRVDTKFQEIALDENGYPLDMKAFAEAKDILFQVPLNRKLFDPRTGKKIDVSPEMGKTLITKTGTQFQSLAEKVPFLKLIFPFIKTPANIAQSALETNPLYMALSPDFKARWSSSDPMVRAKARGHVALCTMMHFGALTMAFQGMVTGSEPYDRHEKAALLKTGWRPYSFYINGKYYSYKNYVPFDAMFAACADIANIYGRVTNKEIETSIEDVCARTMASMLNNYFDQAGFRTNSEKLLDIINPSIDARRREQLIAGLASGYIPMGSAIRDAQSFLHPEVTTGDGFIDRMFKNIAPEIVKADFVRDVFGRRTDIHNCIITQATDADFDAPEYREMRRLANIGWTPSTLKAYAEDTKVPLKEYRSTITGRSAADALGEELSTLTIGGLTLRQAVAELSVNPDYVHIPVGISKDPEKDWANSDYDTQIKTMSLLFKEYYDEAKNRVIRERAEEFVNSKGETMEATSDRVRNDMEQQFEELYPQ